LGPRAAPEKLNKIPEAPVIKLYKMFTNKTMEATKQKEEKRKNLRPRNRKGCHSFSTALLQSIYIIKNVE
jgi:hypothetical protein